MGPTRLSEAMSSNTSNGLALRPGTEADAGVAAALHVGQINEGFLAMLGAGFLSRLYRRVAREPSSFLLVAEDGTTTVGFLAGSTDVAGLYRSFVVRDGVFAALSCAARLLRSWRRVMETLRHGTGGETGAGPELLAVAVDPAERGRGAGALLVEGFLAEIARRGCATAHVVVGADNERAIALYRRAGFETQERFELHAGTASLLMRWLPPRSSPS